MKIRYIIPFILSIILFLITLFMYLCFGKSQPLPSIYLENYQIKIDKPNLNKDEFKEEIKKFIDGQKEFFLKKSNFELLETSSFIISYETKETEINNKIIINSKIAIGDYTNLDRKIIYYNKINNEKITINNFLLNENSFIQLSQISYNFLNATLYNQNIEINNDDKKIITDDIPNYENFEFEEDGLHIIFILNQHINGEIEIIIPYSEINYILKDEYKKEVTSPYKRDLKQFENKKLIAFTFDDGPNPETTNVLLDGLSKYNAKVTFFLLGNKVNAYASTIIRAYLEGNQIGSHTYNHKNLLKLSESQIRGEVNNTASVIKNVIGIEPTVFRPPYGNSNSIVRGVVNIPIITWNIDSEDWLSKDPETIKTRVVTDADDGDIVLFHDIYPTTIEGAFLAMDELYNKGFAFVTIEEMMQLKGIQFEKGKYYREFK